MNTLYFGGSFNPIHHGHLLGARAAAEAGGYERVVLIPSARPPHKTGDLADAADRLAMCRLAVAGDEMFEVDDLELRREGASYTLQTVRELAGRTPAPQEPIHWLIGADLLAGLVNWHRPQELMREAKLMVMGRPGWRFDFEALPPEFRPLRHNILPIPQLEISASDIRNRIRAGRSIRYLVPRPVADYLLDHRLYSPPR